MRQIFEKLQQSIAQERDCMLLTVIAHNGSTPRGKGSQMLVDAQGRITGSIGGGAIEKYSEERAVKLLAGKKNDLHCFTLQEKAEENIGMVCGGDMTVLFTYVAAHDLKWQKIAAQTMQRFAQMQKATISLGKNGEVALRDENNALLAGEVIPDAQIACCLPLELAERAVIFGAGHIAQALTPLLKMVNFRTTVYDCRLEYANIQNFPDAEQVIVGEFEQLSDRLQLQPDDYIVIMTHGHQHDYEVARQVLQEEHAYVGIIGSKRKTACVNERLLAAGISQQRIEKVHAPIGVSIGAVTPAEIAISIIGEMIAVRAMQRDGGRTVHHDCPMH